MFKILSIKPFVHAHQLSHVMFCISMRSVWEMLGEIEKRAILRSIEDGGT
jgi:hypothetical protein